MFSFLIFSPAPRLRPSRRLTAGRTGIGEAPRQGQQPWMKGLHQWRWRRCTSRGRRKVERRGERMGAAATRWREWEMWGVLGFAPPLFGRPPHGPQLGPTAAPPFGLQGCPPWPTRPPLGPAGPEAQVQNRKNRRNAEIANFKFEFEPNSF